MRIPFLTGRLFLVLVTVIALDILAEGSDPARHLVLSQPQLPHATPRAPHPKQMADRIVVYSATWCIACKQLSPVLVALKQDGYKVVVRDVDRDAGELKHDYTAVPTIYFLRGDAVIRVETGFRSKEQIKRRLMSYPPIRSRVASAEWSAADG